MAAAFEYGQVSYSIVSAWDARMKALIKYVVELLSRFSVVSIPLHWLERKMFFRHVRSLRLEAGKEADRILQGTVASGIFAGMKLDRQSGRWLDKYTILTGQYESELYEIISNASRTGCRCFIDIGCADGFYAVGFALISSMVDVIAYDIDAESRELTLRNAIRNGVADRVTVKSEASPGELRAIIAKYGSAFILVDIEGAELSLLDPDQCPEFGQCDLLVEVHGDTEQVIRTLVQRFSTTHQTEVISRKARNPFLVEYLNFKSEDEAWVTVSEGRTFTRSNWLLLVAKRR